MYAGRRGAPRARDEAEEALLLELGDARMAGQVLQVLNGLCADPTVEVEVVAEEPPPGGLAAVPSLCSIHLSREVL